MADLVPQALAPQSLPLSATTALSSARSWLATPQARRWLPAALASGGVAALLLIWSVATAPAQRSVADGLPEADKAAVVEALNTAGFAPQVDSATGAITVPETRYHAARMALAAQGLPKAAPSGAAQVSGLQLGASRRVEAETLRSARETDLAATIQTISAVERARVHIAEPDPSPFLRERAPTTASVTVETRPGRAVDAGTARAIRHLVASSVTGLAPAQVTVIDQSGELLSSGDGDDAALTRQHAIEARIRSAVVQLLTPVVGAGGLSVEAHADLDPSESQATRETFPKDDRAIRSEESNRRSGSEAGGAIGIPGATSNMPPPATQVTTTPATATAPNVGGATTTEERTARAFEVGREVSVTRQPQDRLRRLSVAVVLKQGAKPRSRADLAAIETLVRSAAGIDAARGDTIAVAERTFVAPETVETAWHEAPWLPTAVRAGLAVLGMLLAAIIALRVMRRTAQTLPAVDALPAPDVTPAMIAAAPEYAERAELLREFARQDPERTTRVLKAMLAEPRHG